MSVAKVTGSAAVSVFLLLYLVVRQSPLPLILAFLAGAILLEWLLVKVDLHRGAAPAEERAG